MVIYAGPTFLVLDNTAQILELLELLELLDRDIGNDGLDDTTMFLLGA